MCLRTPDRSYDLGYRRGDVVAGACVDANVVAVLVRLHARAVELPFERRHGNARHRVRDVVGRLRQHRRERLKQRDGEAAQTCRAVGERGRRDTRDPAGDHRRPAHSLRGYIGGSRHGLDHQAFERTLAQLAEQ